MVAIATLLSCICASEPGASNAEARITLDASYVPCAEYSSDAPVLGISVSSEVDSVEGIGQHPVVGILLLGIRYLLTCCAPQGSIFHILNATLWLCMLSLPPHRVPLFAHAVRTLGTRTRRWITAWCCTVHTTHLFVLFFFSSSFRFSSILFSLGLASSFGALHCTAEHGHTECGVYGVLYVVYRIECNIYKRSTDF